MTALAAVLALALAAETTPVTNWIGSDPSGSCKGTRVVVTQAGSHFACTAGTWTAVGGGGGGGGAPTTAQYWTGAADGTLSAEFNLGALATGLVLNTAGTPSAYAGTGAAPANQFLRTLSASGVGTWAQTTWAGASDYPTPTDDRMLIGNGSAWVSTPMGSCGAGGNALQYSSASNAIACATLAQIGEPYVTFSASANFTGERVLTAGTSTAIDVATPDQIKINVVSPVATASALAANGTNCSAGQAPLGVDASGNVEGCFTPGGGSGSGNFAAVTVSFPATGSDMVSTVVTGQTWVSASSSIICTPTLAATGTRSEGDEDALIEGLEGSIHSRVAGTGFTLTVAPAVGDASGDFVFSCVGG